MLHRHMVSFGFLFQLKTHITHTYIHAYVYNKVTIRTSMLISASSIEYYPCDLPTNTLYLNYSLIPSPSISLPEAPCLFTCIGDSFGATARCFSDNQDLNSLVCLLLSPITVILGLGQCFLTFLGNPCFWAYGRRGPGGNENESASRNSLGFFCCTLNDFDYGRRPSCWPYYMIIHI